ncbi:MAG: FAD binding domain-containing protein, partial [Candidatus Aminicenantales bacterium]
MKAAEKIFPSAIKFHQPQTLTEVLKLLQQIKGARILAGGTDILVDLKQGIIEVENLISLQKIKNLRGIEKKSNSLRIGTMTTADEIISSNLLRQYFPTFQEAALSMASYQIRTMATIGGNIASAVPSADLPPPLIAAEASVELKSLDSSRTVLLSDFFTGPRETVCLPEEVLTLIDIPLPSPGTGISFQKFSRREANALAVASVA